jgi:glucokinase
MLIGIDFGGTKILTGLADDKGRLIAAVRLDTEAKQGKKKVIAKLIKSVNLVLAKAGVPLSKVSRIGVGAPGPIINGAIIASAPNLPGWKKVNLKQILQRAFKKPVVIENDANAAALAEYRFGAGKGSKNMIYMTVSTGIGGGIILDGKLYRGSTGTAGEVGHMIIDPKGPKCGCGNHGDLEALSSGPSIARAAGQKDAVKAVEVARKGNKRAKKAIADAAKNLGIGIGNLNNLLNIDIVVIGGGVSNMKELIFTPARHWAKEVSLLEPGKHLKIVPAKLKDHVGVMGAIAIAMEG